MFIKEGASTLKNVIHVLVIVGCIIATILVYNKQLGAIPMLILSLYLFFYSYLKMKEAKNSK